MPPQPTTFYVTGGTLRADAPCYVERRADRDLMAGLLEGHFCYVLTARQMGKSSLMVRTAGRLREQGVQSIVLDLTAVGQNVTPEQWYSGLLDRLGRQLQGEEAFDRFWAEHRRLGPCQRFFAALQTIGLHLPGTSDAASAPSTRRLVVFLDEIDVVRSLPFPTDEFFSAIRECYNRRAAEPDLQRLSFCLLGVASPPDLIEDPRTTPFNIGRRIEVTDFTEEEARPLLTGLRAGTDAPERDGATAAALLRRVLYWTGGHPYLTQRLCQAFVDRHPKQDRVVATGTSAGLRPTPDASTRHAELIDTLCEELFLSRQAQERDDNLLFMRKRLLGAGGNLPPALLRYAALLAGQPVADHPDDPINEELRLAGVVRSADGRLQVRNRIYARVSDLRWFSDLLRTAPPEVPATEFNAALAAIEDLLAPVLRESQTGHHKVVTLLCAAWPPAAAAEPPADRWTERAREILAAHGGTLIRSTPTTLSAAFGGAVSREDEAGHAVNAALQILRTADPATGSAPHQPTPLPRLGLHTGLAIVSPAGTCEPDDPPGSTHRIAADLCQSASPGSIVISHATRQQLFDLFDLEDLPPMVSPGAPGPVRCYRLLRAHERPFRLVRYGLEGVPTPMIGRDAELRQLQETVTEVLEERQVRLLTVVGEPGIGKSRLLHEFYSWLEPQHDLLQVFAGRAREASRGLPYSLLRDLLATTFGIQDSDPPAVARKKLEDGIAQLLRNTPPAPLGDAEDPLRAAHFIGHLAGLDFSQSPHLRAIVADASQIRDRAFHQLARLFRSVATPAVGGRSGVALLLEDLHWADDGSLDLLDHVVRNCERVPLFVLCLARPSFFERRPGWGEGESSHSRLDLHPLSLRDSRRLVDGILHKLDHPHPKLRDRIVEDGEGNPFYLEELIKMYVEKGVIVAEPAAWRVDLDRLPQVLVPPTLAGVLQARLDTLRPAERVVLQHAAVLGRTFWDGAIEHILAPPGEPALPSLRLETRSLLDSLRSQELIFRREASAFSGTLEFTFRHALLRDAIYQSLLPQDRRHAHARAATWLIERSGERAHQFAAIIAAHFEAADDLGNAAAWYGIAGTQARATYAPDPAIEYYGKALRWIERQPAATPDAHAQRLAWNSGLGECLAARARFDEAIVAYEAARAAAVETGDLLAQVEAWNGLSFVQERRGTNRLAIDCAARAAELAAQAGPSPAAQRLHARALFLKGWAFYRLGDPQAVLELGLQALDLCLRSEARREQVNSLKLIACGQLLLGRHTEAADSFLQALALARSINDRRNVAAMLSNLGETARSRGDYATAARHYREAIAVAREIGSFESELLYRSNLAGALTGLGGEHLEAAELELRFVIDNSRQPSFILSETHRFLAEALLGLGRVSEAFDAARRALALARDTENQEHLAGAWKALGLTRARLEETASNPPDPRLADCPPPPDCFATSARICLDMGAQAERARTLRAWATYERQQGDPRRGDALAAEAEQLFGQLRLLA